MFNRGFTKRGVQEVSRAVLIGAAVGIFVAVGSILGNIAWFFLQNGFFLGYYLIFTLFLILTVLVIMVCYNELK